MHVRILRAKEVCDRLSISATTLWRWTQRKGVFPKPIAIPGSSVKGWHESTVDAWINEHYGNLPGGEK
jgi:predicted DNA-binding transcriptional regulator AlpA